MLSDSGNIVSLLIIAFSVGIIFLLYFLRKPFLLIFVTFLMMVAESIFGNTYFRISVGSINISVLDGLSVLLITAAVSRFMLIKQKRNSPVVFIVLVLGILLLVSWIRGLMLFGVETATNSFRPYFYFFSAIFLTISLTYSPRLLNFFIKLVGITGWTLVAIAFIRWGLVGIGFISSKDWIAAGGLMTRVIPAAPTFFLLQVLFLNNFTKTHKHPMPLSPWIPYIFIPVILFLQHRTIWVALIVAIMLTLILQRQIRGVALLGLITACISIILLIELNDFSVENLSGTALDLNNFNWRILGWQALVSPDRYQTPIDFFIGQPFGTGYARTIPGWGEITVSPHNFYIETYLNTGGIGVLIFLSLYGTTIKKIWKFTISPISRGIIILLVTQLVFYLTYSPNYEQGIVLGIAVLFGTSSYAHKEHN